jgi:transposase
VAADLPIGRRQRRGSGRDPGLHDRAGAPGCSRWTRWSQKNEIGRSRGGFSTKIHAAVDIKGRPLEVLLTPGQQHDCTVADRLIDFITGDACLADGSYDTNAILGELRQRDVEAVIPSGQERKRKRRLNKRLYKQRYLVERFFHSLKRFRRIATRYEKTAACYAAMVCVACTWLRI